MIYGYDEPVALPTVDLYDTNMMQMYVNAARELYNRAQEEQKEFLKLYGDFYSPFAKDNDFWYNNTMGPVQQLLLDAASRGIDLTRSSEGRALLAKTLRNIPYAKLATIRRNAAAGEEYLKNRAALQKAGKYNSDYENYILQQQGLPAFEDWDSSTMGAWTRTSPEEYKDLHDSTYQWVDNNKKKYIGKTPDGLYQIWGVTDDDLRSSLTPHLSGFVGNNLGAYHLANAKREVLAENPNMSDSEANTAAMKRLLDNIVQANREYTYREITADPYAQQDRQFAQQLRMEQMKEAAADRRAARAEAAANQRAMLPYVMSGQDTSNILPDAAADQLAKEQEGNYANARQQIVGDAKNARTNAWNNQKAAYNKLSKNDLSIAVKYGKSYRTLIDPKATKEQKQKAEEYIRKANNKRDPNFLRWKSAFENRMKLSGNDDQKWLNYSTTQGRAGYLLSTPQELYKNSMDIFKTLNVVDDLGNDAKLAINEALGYSKDKDNNRVGSMKSRSVISGGVMRDLKAIVVANMTGSRRYKYDSIIRGLSRLLRSKDYQYKIKPDNVSRREYASGTMHGKRYNVVSEIATFNDDEIDNFLKNYSDKDLALYGIRKVDGEWNIPISTTYGHGQTWANINTSHDIKTSGKSEASKRQATRLAREYTNQLQNR